MAGLWRTFTKTFLLLLVLCTPDAIGFPYRNRATSSERGNGWSGSQSALFSGGHLSAFHHPSLDTLAHLQLARQLALVNKRNEYIHGGRSGGTGDGNGDGGGSSRWATQHIRSFIENIKRKRQGFFGIDNPDFVLRTLEQKNAAKTDSPLVTTTDDHAVTHVALINAGRMRNRHRQRLRPKPSHRHNSPFRMSVDTSIEDLRRLMEKQGR